MKHSSYDQFAIVSADSATLFNEQLNAEIFRLKDNNPVVEILRAEPPFFAQVKYRLSTETPETISEAFEIEGVRFVCAQCPCFTAPQKDDGTEDKRCKAGDCSFEGNDLGRALKTAPACDHLYELINEGSVKLCFTE